MMRALCVRFNENPSYRMLKSLGQVHADNPSEKYRLMGEIQTLGRRAELRRFERWDVRRHGHGTDTKKTRRADAAAMFGKSYR